MAMSAIGLEIGSSSAIEIGRFVVRIDLLG